jgi:hypothetical protein
VIVIDIMVLNFQALIQGSEWMDDTKWCTESEDDVQEVPQGDHNMPPEKITMITLQD